MTKSKKRQTIQKTPLPDTEPIVVEEEGIQRKMVPAPKKRAGIKKPKTSATTAVPLGRPPKGSPKGDREIQIANIILHLKCSMVDLETYNDDMNKQMPSTLQYDPVLPPEIKAYHDDKHDTYAVFDDTSVGYAYSLPTENAVVCPLCQRKETTETTEPTGIAEPEPEMSDIHAKLKKLKMSLFKRVSLTKNAAFLDKKSACFWCTYEFDNPECYIPKYEIDGVINGYGSFCRPECAVAYLMKENVDDSTKFERYHLLNQIYSKIYQCKKNIKPAPNPHYLLDKFYGNLTIQEYRKLLKSDHLLLVIDKPLTRILPELHEDTDEFLTGIYGGNRLSSSSSSSTPVSANSTGVYKVKRQSDKPTGPSKTTMIREHFGLQ